HHHIQREALSVREHMGRILADLAGARHAQFLDIVVPAEGRLGVVVCFLAILELAKAEMIQLEQVEPYAPLSIRLASERAITGPLDESIETAYSG
ncbi:MAG: segregation/condensation protein A, partial [Nevskiales bacterium]